MDAAIFDDMGWLRVSSALPRATLDALPLDAVLDDEAAGTRQLLEKPWCAALVAPIRARLQQLGVLVEDAVAVQCTLFRKTPECNWKVPYHQDLSIPVAARVENAALSGWSIKEDGHYVQATDALLANMMAVRVHLDHCDADAGALRVLSGSHRLGRIDAAQIGAKIAESDMRAQEVVCTADVGDLLLMRPLLLHASSKANRPNGRRVLHYLFAPLQPGGGLSWRSAI
jgi:ectoine hydroxylase-related dioxygenase (phytanoyl-CoA dioxygenase family)